MPPVFAHGRLRLYLLKLLDEAPRHGYEVIRLLEERFQGLYAPSAGTVYPRLAKLEKEGLVSHSTEGGRKVYALTDEGRAELASRAAEISGLEREIRESVSSLAAEIREDVRGAAGDLRAEVRAAARQARTAPGPDDAENSKQRWKEQARRAKEESRRAKEEARDARRQAKAARDAMDSARDEVQRIARQVQEQVQTYSRTGDWQTGLREGLAELTRELGQFGAGTVGGRMDAPTSGRGWATTAAHPAGDDAGAAAGGDTARGGVKGAADAGAAASAGTAEGFGTHTHTHSGRDTDTEDAEPASGDPFRDLERLLDRFRDDVRDAARDHGVDDRQVREIRRRLKETTAHVVATLSRRGEH
ncbi:helix-turn-helix transcriptional regulator [Actinacidiphila sp. DG2A-62]|uniref:PadR family transcriptional regulator n=1 Tax=Actinacidiphila sp. DG2A-62 TaxID=3108821 RepID=UPI002DB7D27D|nr:helix-turn-helix transcriptional regulator [Actinacidiphila sp. DG2A-62]MEC3996951.1 helix-turn-helix transcriptional regulator [Actinacidiphila sp. DG2A-62]